MSLKLILVSLALMQSVLAFGQKNLASEVYDLSNKKTVSQYVFDNNHEYLTLDSEFSKETISHIQYTDRRIIRIDLVFTEFSEQVDFDQRELNIARLKNLIDINPDIIKNRFFDWTLVEQTGCQSSSGCKEFFHGFVIYYDKYHTKKDANIEIDSIKYELQKLESTINENQKSLEFQTRQIDCEFPASIYSEEYLSNELSRFYDCDEKFRGYVSFIAYLDYNGRVENVTIKGSLFPCPVDLSKWLKHILQWKRGLVIGNIQYDLSVEGKVEFPLKNNSVTLNRFIINEELRDKYQILSQKNNCVAYEVDTSFLPLIPKVTKRAVSSILYRNKWDEKLIVVDVTGSMFPYTADLLKWIRLGLVDGEKTYVFFNDGNDIPTIQKRIGQTGGINYVRSSNLNDIKKAMFETMRKGGGGDLPENNIEALLYGVSKSGYPNSAIMIADNRSFPRDQELLINYRGGLKIILCETEKGINTNYLDLARKYNFTLHTEETDITNLSNLSVGHTIRVDGFSYKLNGNGFQRINYSN